MPRPAFRPPKAPRLRRPANLEEAAFWPIAQLAQLIRSRQVTSTELTHMYLARLKRYNAVLNSRRRNAAASPACARRLVPSAATE
jgi:Asp-tRNA(Asn)/Glu-tRNA(Gln) amidotransferase A subunit family amidase